MLPSIVDTGVMMNKKICELISSRIGTIWKYKDADHISSKYNRSKMIDALEVMADDTCTSTVLILK
jgi:hypothetical protein